MTSTFYLYLGIFSTVVVLEEIAALVLLFTNVLEKLTAASYWIPLASKEVLDSGRKLKIDMK